MRMTTARWVYEERGGRWVIRQRSMAWLVFWRFGSFWRLAKHVVVVVVAPFIPSQGAHEQRRSWEIACGKASWYIYFLRLSAGGKGGWFGSAKGRCLVFEYIRMG